MATFADSLPHHLHNDRPIQEPLPEKISAYYSLVFPNFTYYIQTLNVIIGRRCTPPAAASSSEHTQVDVDLGSLKSVSRLHAKIEYEEDEERFVLHVLGRNGAWVDGVWSGSGSKVPLGDRSQIQIASRTFHFVLPPPPAPEDSPSPSSHSSSGNRPRSPSVDITSISPPSSIPSCSPPPAAVTTPLPKIPPLSVSESLPQPQLPNSNSIRAKLNPKKRKKAEVDAPVLLKPEDIPPKPQLTYAQLCYRAIKGLSGRGSLQEICHWIQETFEYYKYSDKDWESSVRHNLSSNRAFKKVERGPDEKGKGALWTVDPQHEHMFEEQDAKRQSLVAQTVSVKEVKAPGKKGKGPPLDPPFKRSIKAEKSLPLPPPLTSAPLVPKSSFNVASSSATIPHPSNKSFIKTEATHTPLPASATTTASATPIPPASLPLATSSHAVTNTPTPSAPQPSFPPIPASVKLPIVLGPTPASTDPASPPKPIVLQDGMLILNPDIFSHLTDKQLKDLEALGAQKALEILQSYIVRYFKEKLRAEGARGRGKGKARKGRAGAPGKGGTAVTQGKGEGPSALFTTTPLPPRPHFGHTESQHAASPIPPPIPPMASLQTSHEDSSEEVIVVDDEPVDEAPAHKRRRIDSPGPHGS
ncbi:hypothetical protein C8Q75DRAFT_729396 [Abortiporus biennis]|nr:hypothetical protein C8Q75DRAFT_729396 [Abortiporus biennis]